MEEKNEIDLYGSDSEYENYMNFQKYHKNEINK